VEDVVVFSKCLAKEGSYVLHVQFCFGSYGFSMILEMHSPIFDPGGYLMYWLIHYQLDHLVANGALRVGMLCGIMKDLLDGGSKVRCVVGVGGVVKCSILLSPYRDDILPKKLCDFGIEVDAVNSLFFNGLNP